MYISENALEALAIDNPEELVRLIRESVLDGPDTALAVEVMARRLPSQTVRETLLLAVKHAHPIAREAAILALGAFGYEPSVRDVIRQYVDPENEPSTGVREAALDTLYLFDPP